MAPEVRDSLSLSSLHSTSISGRKFRRKDRREKANVIVKESRKTSLARGKQHLSPTLDTGL